MSTGELQNILKLLMGNNLEQILFSGKQYFQQYFHFGAQDINSADKRIEAVLP
jgi:hypothetical protein